MIDYETARKLDLRFRSLPLIVLENVLPPKRDDPKKAKYVSFSFQSEPVTVLFDKPCDGKRSCRLDENSGVLLVDPSLDYSVLKAEIIARTIEFRMRGYWLESWENMMNPVPLKDIESYVRKFQIDYLLEEMRA